jgi:putative transcriptional regulator
MNAKKKVDRVAGEMIEMATLLSKRGIVSMKNLDQIKALGAAPPAYTAARVAAIRIKKAKMSQAVFAGFLNVRPSTVQKWESPASGKHPVGAAAKLLQIIEKKGIDALAC